MACSLVELILKNRSPAEPGSPVRCAEKVRPRPGHSIVPSGNHKEAAGDLFRQEPRCTIHREDQRGANQSSGLRQRGFFSTLKRVRERILKGRAGVQIGAGNSEARRSRGYGALYLAVRGRGITWPAGPFPVIPLPHGLVQQPFPPQPRR